VQRPVRLAARDRCHLDHPIRQMLLDGDRRSSSSKKYDWPSWRSSKSTMHTRVHKPKHGPTLLMRPLRHGDVRTVLGVFERLSEQSRRARFNGPKPCLSRSELRQLASVDRTRHALVAYLVGDPQPVAIARLVRDGHSAEIAFAVADEHQRRGIGSALAAELIADAREAGITEITALVSSENRAAVALLRRITDAINISFQGPELAIRAAIA
jgi:ribosomal protein S18 acetylase RimI-like enzyme